MPQRCQVCAHSKTKEIDHQIVQGIPHTKIATQYEGLDYQNIWRHAQNHLPDKLVKAVQKKEERHAENMLDGINDLLDRTRSILDQAEAKDQKSLALKAIKEARSTYELLSKIAVKLEEYRRQDEKKREGYARDKVEKGLQALSDQELKAYIQLQAKIFSADPDYELDPKVRMFIDGVKQIWPETKTVDEANGNSFQDDSDRSNPTRNRGRQAKNNKTTRSDEDLMLDDLDDLDLDDLSLDKTNQIPSEETDPDWLRRARQQRRRRNS